MINEIYITTQELLNKNGYGLLTPARFVSFAESAQLKILNEAIDDFRMGRRRRYMSDPTDTMAMAQVLLDRFVENATLSRGIPAQEYHTLPPDFMKWIMADIDGVEVMASPVKSIGVLKTNYFIAPTESCPFYLIEGDKVYIVPDTIGAIKDGNNLITYDEVTLRYYRYPLRPNWTYEMVGREPVFNKDSEHFQDFEVPYAFFNRLVANILGMVSVKLRDDFVAQYAISQENTDFEKRNR